MMYSTPLIQYAFSLATSEAHCLNDSIGTGATERDRQKNMGLARTLRLISNLTQEQSKLSVATENAATTYRMSLEFDQSLAPSC